MTNNQQPDNKILSILANMKELSVDNIDAILENIVYTRYSQYEGIFTWCKTYFKEMGKMPDEEYMNIQFNNLLKAPYPMFHKNYVEEFTKTLKSEAVASRSYHLMLQGKFSDAESLIGKYNTNADKRPLSTPKSITTRYRQLKKEMGVGLKTGIEDFDEAINFFMRKTLNVIVAPSSNFKTTLGCSICYNAVFTQGMNVVYFTLEDNSDFLWYNFLCRHSYEIGKPFSGEEVKKFLMTDDRLDLWDSISTDWDSKLENTKGSLNVVSSEEIGAFTPMNVVNMLNKIRDEIGRIDVVVIDHFNIMNDPIPGMRLSGPELFSYYVRFMTHLSITYDGQGFILLGLSQANREGSQTFNKGKDMDTTQIANTSELERSATTVTSLFADDDLRSQGKVRMKILKNRLGSRSQIVFPHCKPEYFKIGNSLPKNMTQEEALAASIQLVSPSSTLIGVS